MHELQLAIERFLAGCKQPALSEAGEELIELDGENLSLDERNGAITLQAWNDRRNLVRKVTAVESQSRSKLVLRIERFGKKTGTVALLDLSRTDTQVMGRRTARLEFREIFRRFLRREFSGLKIAELSTEPDLEHSLSPAYPRALLQEGSTGWAAIAAAPESSVDGVLSFGLIWLDYVRRRERSLSIRGLILFLPAGQEKNTCLRLRYLDPNCAHYSAFAYSEAGQTRAVDLSDYGNIDTRLEPCGRNPSTVRLEMEDELRNIEGVETIELAGSALSFRVHGLEFAKLANGELTWGVETKRTGKASNLGEIKALAREVSRVRSADTDERHHPLYLRNREAWLESQVRAHIEEIDPELCSKPIYGQVPAFAAGDRGVLDLLAVDGSGRLAVIELKASQDIHLPLQALDYWMRVKWHLDRLEFSRHGYFPGQELRPEAPRLLLVAPALDFHPSNERILRFFSPQIPVERLGVGLEWQKQLKLMYRM